MNDKPANRRDLLSLIRDDATPNYLEFPTFDESKDFDPVPAVQGEPVAQYNRKRIGWELERTAMGDGYYGNALRVAKDIPGLTDQDRAVLDRYATGSQRVSDHIALQDIAMRVYAAHEEELFRVRQDRDTHFGEMMRAIGQVDALQAECEELRHALFESRANDQQTMAYLSEVRALVGGDDFPDMVRRCEKLRKDAERYVPLYEAIQRAAAELPEVWEIHLCVVRDSASVDLIGPDGMEDFYTDNERLDYTVIDALESAINAAMQGDQP